MTPIHPSMEAVYDCIEPVKELSISIARPFWQINYFLPDFLLVLNFHTNIRDSRKKKKDTTLDALTGILFGTNGIRGKVGKELTPNSCMELAQSFVSSSTESRRWGETG